MASLIFHKYEGLGNDFILVDVEPGQLLAPAQAARLCDRHFGVGADGILHVSRAEPEARARMVLLNADGSRPEMCGNGLRCVALHLAIADAAPSARYLVATDAGPRLCQLERAGAAAQVAIELGQARLQGAHRVTLDGQPYEFLRVSMGNPHAVGFDVEPQLLDRLGPLVSESLTGGSNVELVRVRGPGQLEVTVWERGVGRTLACGTGAAAAAVAAVIQGRAPYAAPLQIRLPGGPLEVSVTEGGLDVSLRGPARHVFSGEAQLP
jgi:diaminopimelate epimerase